jgi:hypothetical protein
MKMTLNGKTLNYKVVDIVESYNFHIKFTSIRVQTKKLQILKTDWILYRGVAGATVLRASLPPSPGARYIVLQKNRTIYFCKKKEKCKKNRSIVVRVTFMRLHLFSLFDYGPRGGCVGCRISFGCASRWLVGCRFFFGFIREPHMWCGIFSTGSQVRVTGHRVSDSMCRVTGFSSGSM